MSASNGARARFHRNRKRRNLMRMRMREVMVSLKNKPAADGEPSAQPSTTGGRSGPALSTK